MTLFQLLLTIVPLIMISGTGFITARYQYLSKPQIQGLSKFTFTLAIPVFLFFNMYSADMSHMSGQEETGFDLINAWIGFYGAILTIYLGTVLWKRGVQHSSWKAAGIAALTCTYSNTMMVGLPVILATLGDDSLGTVLLLLAFHSTILFTLTALLAAREDHEAFNWGKTIKGLITNPIIASISSGLIFNLAGIQLPDVISATLKMASQPGITCALFVLGATLSYHKIHADWKPVFAMSVTKLFALPFIAWWFSHHILQLDKQTVIIITLMLASPSGMNAWLMAAQYQQHEGRVASTVVVSSLASIVTVSGWLAFLFYQPGI